MARRAAGRWVIALMLSGTAAASDEAPSLELLLHLAEFADADGRPVDPQGVADAMEVTEAVIPEAGAAERKEPTDPPRAAAPGARAPKPRDRDATRLREDHDEA